jgi:hypothetical protein
MSRKSSVTDAEHFEEILAHADVPFRKLVAVGCDPVILGRLLVMLKRTSLPLPSGRNIHPYMQDDHAAMLNGLTAREAKRIVTKSKLSVRKIRDAMAPLQEAAIWRGRQWPGSITELCDRLDDTFRALEARLGEVGPQKRPAFDWRVRAIIKYVRDSTGAYHDDLLAELIGASSPPGYPTFPSGDALRKWRSERKTVDSSSPCKKRVDLPPIAAPMEEEFPSE